jgi:hypothetical protein
LGLGLSRRGPVTPDRPSHPPNKEIFKYIQAYLRIFKVFLKNIQRICPVCLVRTRRNGQDRLPARPLGLLDELWMPNITTLFGPHMCFSELLEHYKYKKIQTRKWNNSLFLYAKLRLYVPYIPEFVIIFLTVCTLELKIESSNSSKARKQVSSNNKSYRLYNLTISHRDSYAVSTKHDCSYLSGANSYPKNLKIEN